MYPYVTGVVLSSHELVMTIDCASDAAWLMVFNGAIDHIIQNNSKARQNPRGLLQLDGYKRGLGELADWNLQKFGLDRVAKVETLEEIFSEADETSENSAQDCSETMNQQRESPGLRFFDLSNLERR